MKKTYFNPELEIIKLATIQMLAASGDPETSDDPVNHGDPVLGRRGYGFDDEE